jgi:hypothetical protein
VIWASLKTTAVILSVKVASAIPGVSSLLRSQAGPGHRYLPILEGAILVVADPESEADAGCEGCSLPLPRPQLEDG